MREVEQKTDPNNHLTRYEYYEEPPRAGYLKSVAVDPGGANVVTSYETDPRGNVTQITTPEGAIHQFVYNELDWLVAVHRILGTLVC